MIRFQWDPRKAAQNERKHAVSFPEAASSALGKQIEVSMKIMKKPTDDAKVEPEELREHYDFDYSKAKPNRFSERLSKETTLVVLDPDVATVFRTSEAVNEALRVLIAAAGKVTPTKHPPEVTPRTAQH